VKTTVANLPVAIFGYKLIYEIMNKIEKAAEMSVQYPVIPIRDYSLFFPGRRVRAHLRKVESHS
jgi:hypothetical protein